MAGIVAGIIGIRIQRIPATSQASRCLSTAGIQWRSMNFDSVQNGGPFQNISRTLKPFAVLNAAIHFLIDGMHSAPGTIPRSVVSSGFCVHRGTSSVVKRSSQLRYQVSVSAAVMVMCEASEVCRARTFLGAVSVNIRLVTSPRASPPRARYKVY